MNAWQFTKDWNNICRDIANKRGLDPKNLEAISVYVMVQSLPMNRYEFTDLLGAESWSKMNVTGMYWDSELNQLVIMIEDL